MAIRGRIVTYLCGMKKMKKDNLFFRLLRLGLGTETIDNGQLIIDNDHAGNNLQMCCGKTNDLLSIIHYQLSIKQGVGAFLFDGLQKATEAGLLPPDAVSREVKMKLFSHTMQVEQLCKAQYTKAAELAGIYAEHGIRTVVLKGIAAGQCYPNPWHRPCGDLDCFLFDKHEEGNRIAEEVGAEVDPFHYKHSHIKYKGLMVENHRFCTAVRGSKRTKAFERLLQGLLAEEGTTRIGETHLENPSPLFNALFLTLHARNHLLLEGIALRHLCDWAMLLHKHGAEIDWLRFTAIADEYGLRSFADAMTRLSAEYLNVAVPDGYGVMADTEREAYLFEALLCGLEHESSGGSVWRTRWNMIKRLKRHAKRHSLFSDVSFVGYIIRLVYGFIFDRNPKI